MTSRLWLTLLAALGISAAVAQQQSPPATDLATLEAEARADTPYNAEEIMTLPAAKLVAILEDEQASTFEKAKACQRLAVVGDASAVLELAALLTDPKLSHYARFGLEPIPGPAVDAVLREALDKVEGPLLIGIINSIGRRRDPKALEALAKLRHSEDQQAAEAASAALARIRRP